MGVKNYEKNDFLGLIVIYTIFLDWFLIHRHKKSAQKDAHFPNKHELHRLDRLRRNMINQVCYL